MKNKIWVIAFKELKSYFNSPVAYVVLLITISIFNIFFFMIIDDNRESTLRDVYKVMEFLSIFIVPLLTMRLFAEEKLTGTIEFLRTSPIRDIDIIIGKYLGGLIFLTLIISVSFNYYFIIEFFGEPDRMSVFIGFLGLWLEGAFFIAIGLLCSLWTRSQLIAAMGTYVILFMLYFSLSFLKYLNGPIELWLRYMAVLSHSENFFSGILSTSDIVYYGSGIIFCLMLAKFSNK